VPGFAIFGPILDKNQGTRDPNDKGVKSRMAALKLGIVPVFVVLNDDFVDKVSNYVQLDQTSDKAVGRYDKHDRVEVNELF